MTMRLRADGYDGAYNNDESSLIGHRRCPGRDGQHRGPDDVCGRDAWVGDQRTQTGEKRSSRWG